MMTRISEGSETNVNCEDLVSERHADGRRKDLAADGGERSCARQNDQAKRKDLAVAPGEWPGTVGRKAMELPEELVEKIISRMPFPSLYKAACLSRAWYFKFPLPSLSVRAPSLTLQEHIASISSRWPVYCPNYVSKDGILGFDRVSNRWRSMLSLSYLPPARWSSVTCWGSIICVLSEALHTDDDYDVFVANAVSRRWRNLRSRSHHKLDPTFRLIDADHVRILPLGTDGYRVLLVHRNLPGANMVEIQLYNSKLKEWTVVETSVRDLYFIFRNSAFLDEKLYLGCQNDVGDPLQLWVYDLGEKTWTPIPDRLVGLDIIDGALLCCGDRIMVAIWLFTDPAEGSGESSCKLHTPERCIWIYELIPGCLRLRSVAKGPPTVIWGVGLYQNELSFSSDADYIYFGQSLPSCPVLMFNVSTSEWSCVPPASYSSMDKEIWGDFAFEPGLNPFTLV